MERNERERECNYIFKKTWCNYHIVTLGATSAPSLYFNEDKVCLLHEKSIRSFT